MDNAIQIKKQIDDIISALHQRLTDARSRKAKADRESASSAEEIKIVEKALQDFAPLQGYFRTAAVIESATPTVPDRGSNRDIVIDILAKQGAPMTNGEIAKVAHEKGKIKSKKGLPGVYATVATVLARGRTNVFTNNNGQWDLRDRRLKPGENPFARFVRGEAPLPEIAPAERPSEGRKESIGTIEPGPSRALNLAGMPRLR